MKRNVLKVLTLACVAALGVCVVGEREAKAGVGIGVHVGVGGGYGYAPPSYYAVPPVVMHHHAPVVPYYAAPAYVPGPMVGVGVGYNRVRVGHHGAVHRQKVYTPGGVHRYRYKANRHGDVRMRYKFNR